MTTMRNTKALLDIDLQLFDGAAAGAAAGGEAAGEGTAQATESALPKAETKRPGSSRRVRSGAFDNVVFGVQEDAQAAETQTSPVAGETAQGKGEQSGVTTTSDTMEARRQAFEELIEGEYKDVFQEKFQQSFNRRFKDMKGMEQSLSAQKPVIDMLMQRYGVQDGDMEKLQKALENDNAYWEEAAEKAGLTVDQYKAMQKLERENAEFHRMRQQQIGQQRAQQQVNAWMQEAEKVKQIYPTFDFNTEAGNRDFLGLLKSGIPVQKAYELMHMEEIKAGAAKAAAETAGQQMAAKIQSKASRPSENGTSHQSAVIVKNDVHNLSRAERAEIARRVAKGEKIKF